MKLAKDIIRNLAISYGIYIASWWVAYPLAFAYGKLTERITYHGGFSSSVVMPLVTTVPYALVAFSVGASVALLVDSERPFRWAIFPAALYIFFGTIGYHWARQPLLLDRVAQIVDATFMGISCIAGAMTVTRVRALSQHAEDT